MNQELLRIIENVARDKNIDKESIFADLEESMVSAVRKHFGTPESEITVQIDRATGQVAAFIDKQPIDMKQLGRIPAQTAKQVMIQRLKADERDSIYSEFAQRKGDIVNGAVVRYEGGSLVVGLDHRTEAFAPGEQIVGQTNRPGKESDASSSKSRRSRIKLKSSSQGPTLISFAGSLNRRSRK
jgi:N utilization substance protein A